MKKDIDDLKEQNRADQNDLAVITGPKSKAQVKLLRQNVESWMAYYQRIQDGATFRIQQSEESERQKDADLKKSKKAAAIRRGFAPGD